MSVVLTCSTRLRHPSEYPAAELILDDVQHLLRQLVEQLLVRPQDRLFRHSPPPSVRRTAAVRSHMAAIRPPRMRTPPASSPFERRSSSTEHRRLSLPRVPDRLGSVTAVARWLVDVSPCRPVGASEAGDRPPSDRGYAGDSAHDRQHQPDEERNRRMTHVLPPHGRLS